MLDVAAALLVVTALLSWVNRRFMRLPATIGLMSISLVVSLALVGLDGLGLAGALHDREKALVASIDFSRLLMQGMLSLLLFAGALHVDVDALRRWRWQVALLAFGGTAASTLLVAGALWAVMGWVGLPLPFLACLLFGAIVSPTDPIAVLGMLKRAGAPRDLEVVIAGESLFNDGVGVVIFTLLLGVAAEGVMPTPGHALALLAQEAGGGLLFGWALGRGLLALLRSIDDYQVEVLLTLAGVIGGYALADHLHVSGPLAMVVAGLLVGHARHGAADGDATASRVGVFWEIVDDLLNAVLFVVVGMEVVVVRVAVPPLAALAVGSAAIAITLASRWITVVLPLAALPRLFRLPRGAAAVLTWGGLRGGLSIAMALSLPPDGHRETLVALTYAVVAFSILLQGLSFPRLVRATLRP